MRNTPSLDDRYYGERIREYTQQRKLKTSAHYRPMAPMRVCLKVGTDM